MTESYMLQTNNDWQRVLKMVSEFSPAGFIGLGLLSKPPILLEIYLGNRPDNFAEVLLGFKLRWGQAHANKHVRVHIIYRRHLKCGLQLKAFNTKLSTAS